MLQLVLVQDPVVYSQLSSLGVFVLVPDLVFFSLPKNWLQIMEIYLNEETKVNLKQKMTTQKFAKQKQTIDNCTWGYEQKSMHASKLNHASAFRKAKLILFLHLLVDCVGGGGVSRSSRAQPFAWFAREQKEEGSYPQETSAKGESRFWLTVNGARP